MEMDHTHDKDGDKETSPELDPQGQSRRVRPRITLKRTVNEQIGVGGKTYGEVKAMALIRIHWSKPNRSRKRR